MMNTVASSGRHDREHAKQQHAGALEVEHIVEPGAGFGFVIERNLTS